MLEEGTVVELKDNKKALVELERKSACRSCSACSSGASGRMNIEADNSHGAKIGDRVELNIEAKGFVLGIVMLYLLPALGLIFGIIFGNSILLGIVFMFLLFVAARYYGRKKVSYSAEIVEVIKNLTSG